MQDLWPIGQRIHVRNTVNALSSNISFADMAKSTNNLGKLPIQQTVLQTPLKANCSQPSNTNISDFLDEAKSLFNISFKELLCKIRQFWPNYQKLQTKEDKMFAYLDFVASIVV